MTLAEIVECYDVGRSTQLALFTSKNVHFDEFSLFSSFRAHSE